MADFQQSRVFIGGVKGTEVTQFDFSFYDDTERRITWTAVPRHLMCDYRKEYSFMEFQARFVVLSDDIMIENFLSDNAVYCDALSNRHSTPLWNGDGILDHTSSNFAPARLHTFSCTRHWLDALEQNPDLVLELECG